MTLARIIRHFEGIGRVPVELPDVVNQFQEIILDERIEITGIDLPADVLRGAHYRYKIPPHPDSALMDERVVKVVYSLQQPVDWQRLVVCKELVHVFDPGPTLTKAKEAVSSLGAKLATKNNGVTNGVDALFDALAKWRAVAILFPYGMHEELLPLYLAGKIDLQQIAAAVRIPVEYVSAIMDDKWGALREDILA